jgi:U4/U6.U5 tri-snRNP-associated protein 2
MKRKLDDRSDDESPAPAPSEDQEPIVGSSTTSRLPAAVLTGHDCPFLDQIHRAHLDFDFSPLCSVSLSDQNVYSCLVCGVFFQGRHRGSYAFRHAIDSDHHLFINLRDARVWALPEEYEVVDRSLRDIRDVLLPSYSEVQIEQLDTSTSKRILRIFFKFFLSIFQYYLKPINISSLANGVALDGQEYIPGIVGLNSSSTADYINVVVQALSAVAPLRNFFLSESFVATRSPLINAFGGLMRKLWNGRSFKSFVSPHEFNLAVAAASERKFTISARRDPLDFLSWLLNQLHLGLGGTRKPGSSIVYKVFQGSLRVTTRPPVLGKAGDADAADASAQQQQQQQQHEDELGEKTASSPYLFLSMEIPQTPLFKDSREGNLIPQVPISQCLSKFDGRRATHVPATGESKTYAITELPPYLILHLKRFVTNSFFTEKNVTIVTFPVKGLDLGPLLSGSQAKDLVASTYDLVANICHQGTPEKGTYKVHVLREATGSWYTVQDLFVEPVISQLLTVSESYIQILRRRKE